MRVVLDTNVLVSGLLSAKGPPGQLLGLWGEDARFTLVTAVAQLDEVLRVAEYPKIRRRVTPVLFGELVAQMREMAVCLEDLPIVASSPDPDDNVLLAIAQAGMADLLVTGDKRDLLSLVRHGQTRIVTARAALEMLAD